MDVVLNWLWQGGVIALAAAAVLRVIPGSRTQARYGLVWAACIVVLALPTVPIMVAAAFPIPEDALGAASPRAVVSIPMVWWTSAGLAIGLWLVWCGAYAARIVAAVLSLRDTRRQCRECPPGAEARLHHWSRVSATGRRTRVVLSNSVRSAAVLGCGSPVIALAPSLLERLSDADLDRVVIHEWAHVQRRDDVAQLVQVLVRAVAGWHPAVWWLERELELEREVACDEIAVAVTGSAKGYATCLATLGTLPIGPAHAWPALAAVSSTGLHRRILRILSAREVVPARPWRAIVISAGLALATLALAVASVHVIESDVRSLILPAVARPELLTMIATPELSPSDRVSATASSVSANTRVLSSPRQTRPPERPSSTGPDTATAAAAPAIGEPEVVALRVVMPAQLSVEIPVAGSVATLPAETPVTSLVPTDSGEFANRVPPSPDVQVQTPWAAAADAGVAVGRGYRRAGVATGGFFTRLSKKIADSF